MATTDSTSDFEALARRYWDAWGASMREGGASGAAPSGQQAWQDGLDHWTRFVRGQQADAAAAMERFDALARDWYGTMRQLAEGFAGQDASAGDIAAAWRQALGGSGGHPFAALFQAMRGQGQQGLDAWTEALVVKRVRERLDRSGQGLILATHRYAPTTLVHRDVHVAELWEAPRATAPGDGGRVVVHAP